MNSTITLPFLLLLFISCKKESRDQNPPVPETSQQVLSKVVRTTTYGSGISTDETIAFEYDGKNRIVAEGEQKYQRDANGRIVKVSVPLNPTNRLDTYVFYENAVSGKVDYTITDVKAGDYGGRDSIVYVHDNTGRLVKLMEYFSERNSPYALSFYTNLTYYEKGNLQQIVRFAVTGTGNRICLLYDYKDYDEKINPLHSDDEVRMLQSHWGITNNSTHNFHADIKFQKHIEYRADGRPRKCNIFENGKQIGQLTYVYK